MNQTADSDCEDNKDDQGPLDTSDNENEDNSASSHINLDNSEPRTSVSENVATISNPTDIYTQLVQEAAAESAAVTVEDIKLVQEQVLHVRESDTPVSLVQESDTPVSLVQESDILVSVTRVGHNDTPTGNENDTPTCNENDTPTGNGNDINGDKRTVTFSDFPVVKKLHKPVGMKPKVTNAFF